MRLYNDVMQESQLVYVDHTEHLNNTFHSNCLAKWGDTRWVSSMDERQCGGKLYTNIQNIKFNILNSCYSKLFFRYKDTNVYV